MTPLLPSGEPAGGPWCVDQVVQHRFSVQVCPELGPQWHRLGVTVLGHAHRGGVHHESRLSHVLVELNSGVETGRQGGVALLQISDEGLQCLASPSHNGDAAEVQGLQTGDHGSS